MGTGVVVLAAVVVTGRKPVSSCFSSFRWEEGEGEWLPTVVPIDYLQFYSSRAILCKSRGNPLSMDIFCSLNNLSVKQQIAAREKKLFLQKKNFGGVLRRGKGG